MDTDLENHIRNKALQIYLDFMKNLSIVSGLPNPHTDKGSFVKTEIHKVTHQLLFDAVSNGQEHLRELIGDLPVEEPQEMPDNIISIEPYRPWKGQDYS